MAYIYQADVWCKDCGEKIREDLAKAAEESAVTGMPTPDTPETEYDSDQYPKYYDEDQESNGPVNCASGDCGGKYTVVVNGEEREVEYGRFIPGRLTDDGYQNLKAMLDEYTPEDIIPPVEEWAKHWGFSYEKPQWNNPHEWLAATLDAASMEGCDGCRRLHGYATSMLSVLDADRIQNLFQDEMEEDGYFKKPGWYSSEMSE